MALELFSTGFLAGDAQPTHKELADTFIKKALEMNVTNEGAVVSGSRRKLNKTEGEFIKLALDLADRSLKSGNAEIIQNVQRALNSVVPLIGDDVKEELTKLAERDADKAALLIGAAELRHEQQMKLHLGLELSPETRDLVDSFSAHREAAIAAEREREEAKNV